MGGAFGAEFKYALGSFDGTRALAQAAARLAEHLGVGNEIWAALAQCAALACDREWQPVLDTAGDALRLIRERGAPRLVEPSFLAYLGVAQLELGHLEAGRARRQRESCSCANQSARGARTATRCSHAPETVLASQRPTSPARSTSTRRSWSARGFISSKVSYTNYGRIGQS